jgi:cell division septum initiation protein DivIVA
MYPNHEGTGRHQWSRRISVAQIRSAKFGRTSIGRRGFNEDEVVGFLHRLAEEVSGLEADLASVRAENSRIKAALRDWQRQVGDSRSPVSGAGSSVDAINLISRAQRQIEAQVAETARYCRMRELEARQRYEEIVNTARMHAKEDADRVAHAYRANSGGHYSPEGERAERTGAWLNALLRSLDALAAHVDATRRTFATEVEKLTESPAVTWDAFNAAPTSSGTVYPTTYRN